MAKVNTIKVEENQEMIQGIVTEEVKVLKKRGRKSNVKLEKTETEKVLETYTTEEVDKPKIKKKSETKKVSGGWNSSGLSTDDDYNVITENMYIEIELLTDSLGMMPPNKDILNQYIASKAPDALTRAEEVELYGEEEISDRQTTIWPTTKFYIDKETDHAVDVYFNRLNAFNVNKDQEELVELPFLYNYQMRGLFKDACGLLARAKNNESAAIFKGYKKIIDGNIFVFPRHIGFQVPETYIDEFGNEQQSRDKEGRLTILQRPIRISGPQGERTALNSSEFIPAGSRCKLRIGMTNKVWRKAIEEWLNYGLIRGIGQWRNSSSGLFRWRELDSNWMPLE